MSRTARRNPLALALLLMVLLAACSPRELPPQLAATAAPAYTLTDTHLTTALYQVAPPTGWRIIAGPAEDPYTFQFIAPANDALIVLSNHAQPAPPTPAEAPADALEIISETVTADDGVPLYVVLVAPKDARESLLPVRDALRDSIVFR